MNYNVDLSKRTMQQIRLCDCSHIKDGYNLFLDYMSNAKQIEDLSYHYIIPSYEEAARLITGKIYHYTNADALFNILKSGGGKRTFTLRLYRVDYMNDIYDGKDMFEFIFDECIKSEQVKLSSSFKQYVIDLVNSLQKGQFVDASSRQVSYVSSLTIDGDSLPMWRNYTSNGGGYNIAFNPGSIWDYCITDHNMTIIPVVYDYDLMVSIINTILSTLSLIWEKSPEEKTPIGMFLFRSIMLSKLSFKHPCFSHEQEIRIVKIEPRIHGINQSEKYAVANGIMRPYIEVDFPKDIFLGVTVGPLLEADAAKRTVENVIEAYGGWGSSCKVDISAAPIRF
jgi:hypothetical protein